MLGVVFFIQSSFTDRNNDFNKKILYVIKDINFPSSNAKRYFTFDCFLQNYWGLKIAKFYVLG